MIYPTIKRAYLTLRIWLLVPFAVTLATLTNRLFDLHGLTGRAYLLAVAFCAYFGNRIVGFTAALSSWILRELYFNPARSIDRSFAGMLYDLATFFVIGYFLSEGARAIREKRAYIDMLWSIAHTVARLTKKAKGR